jgi:hypothetical protein
LPTWSPSTRAGVIVIAVASGVVGAAAGCAPVGGSIADHALTGILAAAVTFAAAQASGIALVVTAAAVVAAGGYWEWHVVGMVALVGVVGLELRKDPRPAVRAFIGALLVQVALRFPWTSPTRGSAVVALVVMLVVGVSGLRRAPARTRRAVFTAGGALVGLAVIATIAATFAVLRSRNLLESGEASARAGVDAARAGDRVAAADQFMVAETQFDDARAKLGSWSTLPARQLPLVGPQLRTLDDIASLGARTIPIARTAATSIDPDRLRLVNGRLDLSVLASYRPTFDDLAAQTRLVRADLGRLPRTWLVAPLEHQLVKFEATVARADDSAQTADEAVQIAPALLGGSGTRTYLVSIVTPAESRGSGGLMANFGMLTASDGRIHLAGVGRGPDLDTRGVQPKHLTGPAGYLARYGKFDPAGTWENVTMSPDFPSVGQVMAQLYPQSGGTAIDGVIQVDPFAIAQLLTLTGPVKVPGLDLTLDANNAVSFLLRDEYTLVTDPIVRSNLLGTVAQVVFDRLTSGESAQPSSIAQALSPVIATGDLALWMRDAHEQDFVRRIGADAALPPVRGDSFGVIQQNAGGNKIDDYLHRTISYSATVAADTGAVRAHASVVLRNDSPSTGVPLYVIGNEVGRPTGTNTLYVSIYSPLTLRGAQLDGKPLVLLAETELGRNVYSAYVEIPPGGTRTITLDLAGSISLRSSTYQFEYLAQVLPNVDQVDWSTRFTDGHVTTASAHGALPISVTRTNSSVSVVPKDVRGPWNVDLDLRR